MATATADAKQSAPSRAPAGKYRSSSSGPSKSKFNFIRLDGLQHNLKLRTKLAISDQLSAEIGADYNLSRQDANPQAALFYEVLRKGNNFATLRLSLDRLAVRKPFSFQRDNFGLRVSATAGATFDGKPEVGFDLDQVRPGWALLIPAAILLLAGKPLSGNRSFGNLRANLPYLSDDAVAKAEGAGSLQKKGKGLQLGLHQVNAVLRL